MSNTTLWNVYLRTGAGACDVIVSAAPLPGTFQDHKRIRTIQARAAARRYIRGNLATALHLADDGAHEPGDLVDPGPSNQYKPHKALKSAKRNAKRANPQIVIL